MLAQTQDPAEPGWQTPCCSRQLRRLVSLHMEMRRFPDHPGLDLKESQLTDGWGAEKAPEEGGAQGQGPGRVWEL